MSSSSHKCDSSEQACTQERHFAILEGRKEEEGAAVASSGVRCPASASCLSRRLFPAIAGVPYVRFAGPTAKQPPPAPHAGFVLAASLTRRSPPVVVLWVSHPLLARAASGPRPGGTSPALGQLAW